MSDRCTILAGGDSVSRRSLDMDFIVDSVVYGADKGYCLAKKLGIDCDIVIGDFDSSPQPDHKNVITFPVEKDDTDLMLCIKHALEKNNCKSFQIYAACGGRADHLYANIQALSFLLDNGANGVLIGEDDIITLLEPGNYSIARREGFSLSLFAYSDSVEKLSVKGTKYEAEYITLSSGFPLGVSNRILSPEGAEISFSSGRLLVIESNR